MYTLNFRCTTYNPEEFTGGTIFLISAFKTRKWFYGPIISALLSRGFNVHVYDYAWRPLLEVHPEEWVEFGERMTKDISEKIEAEKDLYPSARFGIIGVSVGSVLAMHAAKMLQDLEKIMLVTLYGSSAQHVWEHPSLYKMQQKFESTGRDVRDAAAVFGYLEPLSHLDLIGHRKILLYANERDPVIRFSNTQLFIDEAKRHHVNLLVRRINARRHSTTILKVFKESALWVPFFVGLKRPKRTDHHMHEFMVG